MEEAETQTMGDLYLHLGFARRVRFADGLHPVVVEALVRAPDSVVLGATLPHLPEVENKGASFFRRLFMPGKQKRAFWMKALEPAGTPSLELALAVLTKGKGDRPGGMVRFALGLGVLSHQVLHARVREVTADLEGSQRDATDRALARLYLEKRLPSLDALPAELKPVLRLEDTSAHKLLVEHLNGALKEAHGEAPGTETLWRWMRGLCADVEPLTQRTALPASLGVSDDEAREKYGEALDVAVADARRWFVFLGNRLAPLFLVGDPTREQMRDALVDDGDALRRPDGADDEGALAGFHAAIATLRREHLGRGRNDKPAFDEASGATAKAPAGMPSLPEDGSGPLQVPAHTQEISVSDIESELSERREREAFAAPAHTQEVSVAQIEEQLGSANRPPRAPASTQQVSLDDIQEELAAREVEPPPTPSARPPAAPASTQQVSLDQIEAELQGATVPAPSRDPGAPFLAGAVPVPPPPPGASAHSDAHSPTSDQAAGIAPASSPPVAASAATAAVGQAAGSAVVVDDHRADGAHEAAPAEGKGAASGAATADEEAARGGSDPAGA